MNLRHAAALALLGKFEMRATCARCSANRTPCHPLRCGYLPDDTVPSMTRLSETFVGAASLTETWPFPTISRRYSLPKSSEGGFRHQGMGTPASRFFGTGLRPLCGSNRLAPQLV
jgi:hypothetical protein